MTKSTSETSTMPFDHDPNAESRKSDHIELALRAQVAAGELDTRFWYEPLFAGHPTDQDWPAFAFLGSQFKAPLWVSSMTGGTEKAKTINRNLARACGEFGMGMGLGSCRALLYSDDRLADFAVKPLMGEQPLYANLGIAQLEQLIAQNELYRIDAMMQKLDANGLIIHVNPMQEWLQPEGDRFAQSPLETIERILEHLQAPIIVKEVGQGMGPASLRALLQLPLAALDFAAAGGTNFAKLELLRDTNERQSTYTPLYQVGHSAAEMLGLANQITEELGTECHCEALIISGGIKNFLDGYYLVEKAALPAVYGQASGFLQHAQGEYEALKEYVAAQIAGLSVAKAYLRAK